MGNTMTVEELFNAFKAECFDRSEEIDPDDDYRWDDLAFGFAIAKGVGRAMAFHLSLKWFDYCNELMTIDEVVERYDPNIFDEE